MNRPQLILAPMAATNCTAFRLLCKKYGADMCYTQMYHVENLIEISKDRSIEEYLNIKEQEHPIRIQLIGAVNDNWEEAVKLVEPYGEAIDINLGCPDTDMLERRCGSYLLNQPAQITKIVEKVKSVASKPITAKIRSGWKNPNYLEIGHLLEDLGVTVVAFHPRTKAMKYTGKADWTQIKKLKSELKVPVIGNGDITMAGHAKAMLEQTKCDGIMVGREAIKNPAIFFDIKYLLENGSNNPNPISKKEQMTEFIDLYEKYETNFKINQVRDHICWMSAGLKEASEMRKQVRSCETLSEIRRIIENI